jgi:formylglycine-generating enzyme required for sulfatase activity
MDAATLKLWRQWRQRHQDRDPTSGLPRRLVNSIGMELVLVPAGTYLMGSPETEEFREKDEGPLHEVAITRPFYLGAYQVTQEQYTRVIGSNPSHFSTPR